jgi:uroporphyrin-III C-methyltransferase
MSETSSNEPVIKAPAPEVSSHKTANTKTQSQHPPKKRTENQAWIIILLLIVIAGIGGGGYFLWQNLQATAQRLQANAESTRQQLDILNRRTDELDLQVSKSLSDDVKNVQNRQQALEDSLANLRSELTGNVRVWDVEEIATLLQIANDRLHLEKEVSPSLAALEAADRHLEALKNPSLLEVRRQLAEEISALRASSDPDIEGMALSLDALINGIDRLPITNPISQQTSGPTTASERGWRGILKDIWVRLKSLVSIQHHGQAERPLLAPDERYFLRQNLRLNLESARIALLRRDTQTFQQTIRDSQNWINKYFDSNVPATSGALQELAHLQQVDITPNPPDISGSLNALKEWLNKQEIHKAVHKPGVPGQ